MKSPKTQLPKFEATLEEGFWQLAERLNAEKHENQTVTTATEWVRDFSAGKNPKQILKSIGNLLQRAAEYADIPECEAEITIGDNPSEIFSYRVEKPTDYFKIKSWK
jgi:hypothetical protein